MICVMDMDCECVFYVICVFLRRDDKVDVQGYKNRVFYVFGWDKMKQCLYLLFIFNVFYGLTDIRYIFILLIY